MGHVNLERRLTHGYVGTWAHLDKWEHVGVFDRLTTRRVRTKHGDEHDITEPRTMRHYGVVHVPAGTTDEQIEAAFHDTFSRHGCDHEHDCCGCRSFGVGKVKRVTGDLWCVTVHSSRNY